MATARPKTTNEHLADQTVIITLHYMTPTPDPNHVRCVIASPGMGLTDMPATTEDDGRSLTDAIVYRTSTYEGQGYHVEILAIHSEGVDWSP